MVGREDARARVINHEAAKTRRRRFSFLLRVFVSSEFGIVREGMLADMVDKQKRTQKATTSQ
jgi:hypothetical protein